MSQQDSYFSGLDTQSAKPATSDSYFSGLNSSSNTQDVKLAQSDLGDQSYDNYCQEFVDNVLGTPAQNRALTAKDAWSNYQQTGQATTGTDGIQPGDIVYFTPTAKVPEGHTGIYTGNNNFVSATWNGVENNNLDKWQKTTGQQVLGYVKNPENLPQIGGQNGSN